MLPFSNIDLLALGWYIFVWAAFSIIADHSPLKKRSLSYLMDDHRERWARVAARRDLRVVDASIIAGLQNGTAFFASTSLLAIGAGFALLSSTDLAMQVSKDLSLPIETSREQWEAKALILIATYVYAFFKFGWAYRLFNYTSILFAAMPYYSSGPQGHEVANDRDMEIAIAQATEMNSLAGRHFNLGLRAFFFSLALFGWFIHSLLLMVATTFVAWVLVRRQFFSRSQTAAQLLVSRNSSFPKNESTL